MDLNKTMLDATRKAMQQVGQTIEVCKDVSFITILNTTAIVKYKNEMQQATDFYISLKDNYKFILFNKVKINDLILYKDGYYKITSVENTVNGIYTAYAEFKTYKIIYEITLTETTGTYKEGDTFKLTPVCKKNGVVENTQLSYTSDDISVATVDANGLVTVLKENSNATINVAFNGVSATYNLNVLANSYSVEITNNNNNIQESSNLQITTVCKKNGIVINNPTLSYTTNNTNIATISENGLVTAIKEGATTITASFNGISATYNLSIVKADVYSISTNNVNNTIEEGSSVQLTSICKKNAIEVTGQTIIYTIANNTIASVGVNGLVTGIKAGTTTITATWQEQNINTIINISVTAKQVVLKPIKFANFANGDVAKLKINTTATYTVQNDDGTSADGREFNFVVDDDTIANIVSQTATTVTIKGLLVDEFVILTAKDKADNTITKDLQINIVKYY